MEGGIWVSVFGYPSVTSSVEKFSIKNSLKNSRGNEERVDSLPGVWFKGVTKGSSFQAANHSQLHGKQDGKWPKGN